jgi:transcriptional regulator with XRE-family HTH domain
MATEKHPDGLAKTLTQLFELFPNPATKRPYTFDEAAEMINRRAAELPEEERKTRTISSTYIWQLARGKRSNPTVGHLSSLADLFGISLSQLIDAIRPSDNAQAREDLKVIAAMRSAGVLEIMHRVRGLPEDSRRTLLAVLEHAQLSSPPDSTPPSS